MGFGQLGQGVALLVAQLGLGLLLAGQGGFDVGTAGFLAFRVAGLLLAARFQGVFHLLLGALVGQAGGVLGVIGLLYPLVVLLEGLFSGGAGGVSTGLGALGFLDGGQQAGFVLGVVGQRDGGKVQRQAEQVVAGVVGQLGGEVAALQQFRADHLAELLLPAGAVVAQEVAQAALFGGLLLVKGVAVLLGALPLLAALHEMLFGGVALALVGFQLAAQRFQGGPGRAAGLLGVVQPRLGQLSLLGFFAGLAGHGQLGLQLGQLLDA